MCSNILMYICNYTITLNQLKENVYLIFQQWPLPFSDVMQLIKYQRICILQRKIYTFYVFFPVFTFKGNECQYLRFEESFDTHKSYYRSLWQFCTRHVQKLHIICREISLTSFKILRITHCIIRHGKCHVSSKIYTHTFPIIWIILCHRVHFYVSCFRNKKKLHDIIREGIYNQFIFLS